MKLLKLKPVEPLSEELNSFLSKIEADEEPEITGEDGLKALKMVLAANKSSKEHSPINFK